MFEYNIIGEYSEPDTLDEQGEVIKQGELVTYEGRTYHVNATGEVPEPWIDYEVFPKGTPIRVYQKQPTRFFVLKDAEQFEGLLQESTENE